MKRVGTLLARSLVAALLVVGLHASVASADPGPAPTVEPQIVQPEDPGLLPTTQPQDPGLLPTQPQDPGFPG